MTTTTTTTRRQRQPEGVELPFSFRDLRIAEMRTPVVTIALLREGWTSPWDLAYEADVHKRTANNLLLWARTHFHVESRPAQATVGRRIDSRLREYRLTAEGRRHEPLGACRYTCCRDRRAQGGVFIFSTDTGLHMWSSTIAEHCRRSAVMVEPGQWLAIGEAAPDGVIAMADAVRWVADDSRSEGVDTYAAPHADSEEHDATAFRSVGEPAVASREARERHAAR